MAPVFDISEEIPGRGSGLCLQVQSSLINIRGEPLERWMPKGRFQKAYGILFNIYVQLDWDNIFKGGHWSKG